MSLITHIDSVPLFTTVSEAEAWGRQYGLSGYHQHTVIGQTGYMGGKTHTEIVAAMKSKLIAIPSIIAPQLSVESEVGTIRQILSNQINECLEELSNYDPKQSTSLNDTNNAEPQTSSKTNSKQVGRPRKASIIGG